MEDFEQGLKFAYFAGFFDADGTVGVYRGQMRISVTQKYPLVLNKFVDMWGGKVYHHPDGHYQWAITGNPAAIALENIKDFLIEKKRQAVLAIEYQSLVGRQGVRVTESLRDQRAMIAMRLVDAKRTAEEGKA